MTTKLWLLTHYTNVWEEETLHLVITTDIPCHLWLRWTDKEEHIHNRQKDRRGVRFLSVPDYCFVEWHLVDQEDPGDTILHTFHFNGWTPCITRWWYFAGTITSLVSPSTSPIFTEHYPGWMTTPIPIEDWTMWFFPNGFKELADEPYTGGPPIYASILLEEWTS